MLESFPIRNEEKEIREQISPNTLHAEHLKEGIKPIMTAFLDEEDLEASKEAIEKIKNQGEFVDYEGSPSELTKNNISHGGYQTYAISDSTSSNKWSKGYWNCTGIAVIGKNKNGEEISFLSHQDPRYFITNEKDLSQKFKKDLLKLTCNILFDSVFR